MGPQLVKKSIYLILGNLGPALRATAVPLGIGFGLAMAVIYAVASDVLSEPFGADAPSGAVSVGAGLGIFLASAIAVFGFLWAAVAWHRFVLLEEVPGPIPTLRMDRIGAYLWATVRLIVPILILVVILGVGFGLVGGLIAALGESGGAVAIATLLTFGLSILFTYGLLRFSLALPAAAVGEHIGVFESWGVTSQAKDTILIAAALLGILTGVLNLAAGVLGGMGIIGVVISVAISWFTTILGLSILTAIYGYVVENRPL